MDLPSRTMLASTDRRVSDALRGAIPHCVELLTG
jgi:hypothetical protein